MIARKSAMLVLALLVLQFLGPLLHAHFSGPKALTQTGMHLHANEIPEFTNSATLEAARHLLIHEHQIKTVTLQQALNSQDDLSIADWQFLLPLLLLLLPLMLQCATSMALTLHTLSRQQRPPSLHAPRAPPLA